MSSRTLCSEGVYWDSAAYDTAPTHLKLRLKARTDPTLLVSGEAPYKILAANAAWQKTCGYGKEAIGQSPKILQGAMTDQEKAATFQRLCQETGHGRVTLVNYTKQGAPFAHRIKAVNLQLRTGPWFIVESNEVPESPLRRAVLKKAALRADTATQILTVVLSLLIAVCLIASSSMASLAASASEASIVSSFFFSSSTPPKATWPTLSPASARVALLAEATPVAVMILLSFFTVAIKDLEEEVSRGRAGLTPALAEKAAAVSILLSIAAVAAEAACDRGMVGGMIVGSFAALGLMSRVDNANDEGQGCGAPRRSPRLQQSTSDEVGDAPPDNRGPSPLLSKLEERGDSLPLTEVLLTTVAGLVLVDKGLL